METKPFDEEMWKKCDGPTKELVANLLTSTGRYTLTTPLEDQHEAYKRRDFRVISTPGDWLVDVEVEQKLVWTKEHRWQGYPTLDVPARKNESTASLYFMANKHLNTLACTQMPRILGSPVYRKNTKHNLGRTYHEKFFAVDLKHCTFFSIKDNVVRRISPEGKVLETYSWRLDYGL
jgi:hypothetical protein